MRRMHWHGDGRKRFGPAFMAMGGGRGWDFGPGGFTFSWGPGGGGGRGSKGRRRRMFDSGQLRLVLLKLISEEPRHGYDLIRALEEMTGGGYSPSPGTVYPTLTLLEDMGLIEEKAAKGAKRLFGITADGEAYLDERAEEVERLMARLERHGEHHERAGRAPIRKAIANVMTALWHKVAAEDASDARLQEIADILDDAARRIEKL